MARSKGVLPFAATIETEASGPLDARERTGLKSDLILEVTWEAKDGSIYAYPGMKTVVFGDTKENNGLYILNDLPITLESNWVKIGGLTAEQLAMILELEAEVAKLKTDKQDTLVSGTNIKTINGIPVIGEGNIVISTEGPTGVISINGENGIVELDANDVGALPLNSLEEQTVSAPILNINNLEIGSNYAKLNGLPLAVVNQELAAKADLYLTNETSLGINVPTETTTVFLSNSSDNTVPVDFTYTAPNNGIIQRNTSYQFNSIILLDNNGANWYELELLWKLNDEIIASTTQRIVIRRLTQDYLSTPIVNRILEDIQYTAGDIFTLSVIGRVSAGSISLRTSPEAPLTLTRNGPISISTNEVIGIDKSGEVASQASINTELREDILTKQNILSSGDNIKTLNNQSLLGSGNILIDTFSGDYADLTNKPTIPTRTGDLINNAGFITITTETLQNYYTETEIDSKISTIENSITSSGAASNDYTDTEIDKVISTAPETLNNLDKLAQAINDDPNFSTTINDKIDTKADATNVYTKSEADILLGNKADSSTVTALDHTNIKKIVVNGTEELTPTLGAVNLTIPEQVEVITVHNELTGRDTVDSHPISAITGLQTNLNTIVGNHNDLSEELNGFIDQLEANLTLAYINSIGYPVLNQEYDGENTWITFNERLYRANKTTTWTGTINSDWDLVYFDRTEVTALVDQKIKELQESEFPLQMRPDANYGVYETKAEFPLTDNQPGYLVMATNDGDNSGIYIWGIDYLQPDTFVWQPFVVIAPITEDTLLTTFNGATKSLKLTLVDVQSYIDAEVIAETNARIASETLINQSISNLTNTVNTNKGLAETAITNIIDGAPDGLNTLNELAAAINDDPNFSTTVNTAIGLKADKSYVDDQIINVTTSITDLETNVDGKLSLKQDSLTSDQLQNISDVSNKVDKIEGKGLSTNDFTTEEKNAISSNTTRIQTLEDTTVTEPEMAQAIFMDNIAQYEDEEIFHVKSMSNSTSQITQEMDLTLNSIEGNTVDSIIDRDKFIPDQTLDGVTVTLLSDKSLNINGIYSGTEIKEIDILPLQSLTFRTNRKYFFHGTQIYTNLYSFIILDNLGVPLIDSQKNILSAVNGYEFATTLKLRLYPGASFNNLIVRPVLIDITNSLYEDFSIQHLRDIFIKPLSFGLIHTTPDKLTSIKENQCINDLSNIAISATDGSETNTNFTVSNSSLIYIPLESDVSMYYYDVNDPDQVAKPLSPRWYDVNGNYLANTRTENGMFLRCQTTSNNEINFSDLRFMVTLTEKIIPYAPFSIHLEYIDGLENLKSIDKNVADVYSNGILTRKIGQYTLTGLENIEVKLGLFTIDLPIDLPRASSKTIFAPSKSTVIPSANNLSSLTLNTLGIKGDLHEIYIYYPEISDVETLRQFIQDNIAQGTPINILYELETYIDTPLDIANTLKVYPNGSVAQIYSNIPYVIKYNTFINLKDSNLKSVNLLEDIVIRLDGFEHDTYNKYYTERLIKSEIENSASKMLPDNYYTKDETYNRTEIDGKISLKADISQLNLKANKTEVYTQQETVTLVDDKIAELFVAAPEDLNTVNSIVSAIQENQEVTDILNAAIGNKADQITTYTKLEVDAMIADVESKTTRIEQRTLAEYEALPQAEKDSPNIMWVIIG